MRFVITSDWELTTARLPVAEKILHELSVDMREQSRKDGVLFYHLGDMFREYNAQTIAFARQWLRQWKHGARFIVGNHDREIGIDRISAILDPDLVCATPQVTVLSLTPDTIGYTYHDNPAPIWAGNTPGLIMAFLPAPDRAAFGASRGAEGKRARDAALSAALESALISLETQIGEENLSRAVLFAHAATDGAELGVGQLASGLTWTIPGARLARWGRVFLGHVHKPGRIAENVWSVGGIASWTFSDRAEQFRALTLDTDTLEVGEIPLKRVLVPIEMELNTSEQVPVEPAGIMAGLEARGVDIQKDTVALKIKARLPQHEMAVVPKADDLRDNINDMVERQLIQSCIITREVTGLHKARLTTEQSAREMSLEQMLDLYVSATGADVTPEMVDAAKARLSKVAEYYRAGEGNFGFRPLTLEVKNFRQWSDARLDFNALRGAVALTGPMASGKSNLLEAILVALFKQSPSSTASIEDELRLGEQSGHVILTFDAHGQTYLLRRAFERGRGGVSCKSEFMRATGGTTLEPVNDTAPAIDAAVAELVGSYEFVLSTIFRAQRDLDRLIDATPAQWHKIMLEALALGRFEPLRKVAANNAENAALRVREATVLIRDYTATRSVLVAALEATPEDEMHERLDSLAAKIVEAETHKREIGVEREAAIARRTELRGAISARIALETRLRNMARALEGITITPLGDRPEPVALSEGATVERLEHLKVQIEKAGEGCQYLTALTRDTHGKWDAAQRAIESLLGAKAAAEKRIAEWQQAKEKLPETNCESARGQKEACHFYQAAVRPETGARLLQEIGSYDAKMISHSEDIARMAAILSNTEQESAEAHSKLEALTVQAALVDAELKASAKRLTEIEAFDIRSKAQEQLVEQRAQREAEIKGLEEQIISAPHFETEISDCLKEIERLEIRIRAHEEIVKAAQSSMREVERNVERRRGIVEQVAKLEEQIEAKHSEIAAHTLDQSAWGLVTSAFHHTGIPYLLLERVAGSFEGIANEILDGTGLTVQVETVTPTRKGEARDRFSVKFTDDRGQHWLSQASGGQSITVSTALSAALAVVGSQFWGAVPELFVQDEGFSRFGAGAQDVARQLIAAIARRFSTFIYITHTLPLADSADVQLRVEAEGGVSRLVA